MTVNSVLCELIVNDTINTVTCKNVVYSYIMFCSEGEEFRKMFLHEYKHHSV